MFPPPGTARAVTGEVFFTVNDMPFAELIPKWFSLYGQARTAVQMLAGARYLDVGYVTTRLLTVCSAVESLHLALYDHPLVEDEAVFTRMKRAAGDAVKDFPSADRNAIKQQIQNRMFYKDRAMEVAEKVPEDLRELILTDPGRWAKALGNSRNELAHQGSGGLSSTQQYYLMLVTQVLLNLVVATELGFPRHVLQRYAQQCHQVTAGWREHLPD